MKTNNNTKTIFLFLMILSMIIWGGSWVAAKVIAPMAATDVVVFWRNLIAFVSFMPVVVFAKKNLFPPRKVMALIAVNAVFMVGYAQCFFGGLVNGLPGAGGVIVTTLSPIITFIIVNLFRKNKISRIQLAGLILGLISGILMLRIWRFDITQLSASGNLLFLTGAFLWALITITSTKIQADTSIFTYSFWFYLFAAVFQFIISPKTDFFSVLNNNNLFWLNMAYLAILSTSFATSVYFIASKTIGANMASSFMFVVPFSAVILSWVILGETPSIFTVIGGAFAISAIFLIQRKKQP